MATKLNIYRLSENAVTIQFGNNISEDMLNIIKAYNSLLHSTPFQGFIATTPAYATLTVFFDYFTVQEVAGLTGSSCFENVCNYLNKLNEKLTSAAPQVKGNIIEIPVCYSNEFGTDMAEVSTHTRLSACDIVQKHTASVYVVHMIGFIPGFAYLGGMDEQLSTPRKKKVNPSTRAGAVGIAGQQTGIYPIATPGGWQIIGCTPVTMFDISNQQPSLLKAGDRVRFKSISKDEFENYTQQ
ncbi:MAG: 5-oxoprolinase subunit PxpB [Sphingobacteriaceae bacterium]|nr:MAG: 5-oxoprolinase subunit PxpB [Sphingobacteriaceae bacterium]